ncbi:MAG: T9SS type A sorting domain-containing protein [Bacteroidota bacterium]|nr:T9SS type A sorting domain-containing protein [Bacteroidota bacterium]
MYGGKIKAYARNSSCVLVSTKGGIFKTSDWGQNWINGTQTFNPFSVNSDKIVSIGNDFYAQSNTYAGNSIYKSNDNGLNWSQLPSTTWGTVSLGKLANTLYVIGSNYVTGGALYASIDGSNWTQKATIWTGSNQPSGTCELLSFNQDKLYLILQNSLYYTTDGNTLNPVSVSGLDISSFSDNSDNIQGDASGNLYYYNNNNNNAVYKYNFTSGTWSNLITGKMPDNYQIMGFSATDNALFLVVMNPAMDIKFYKSTDQGATFTEQTATGLTTPMISNIIEASANVFIGNGLYNEILVSSTGGSSWSEPVNQFTASYAGDLTLSGSTLLFTSENRGIIASSNQGANWGTANTGIPGFGGIAYFVNEIMQVKDTLFSILQPSPFSDLVTLYKSSNNGNSWSVSPFPSPYSKGNQYTFAGKCDSALFVNYFDSISSKYALIVTFNNGTSWAKPNSQNTDQLTFLKGTKKCLFAFTAYPEEWNDFSNVSKANSFGLSFTNINPNNLFNSNFLIKRVSDRHGNKQDPILDFDLANNKAIFVVTDRTMGNIDRLYLYNNGTNAWSEIYTTGLPSNYVANCIKNTGNNNWLLATNLGLYQSTNGGANWTLTHDINSWQKGITVNRIHRVNNEVFLGTLANGIWTVNLSTGIAEPMAESDLLTYPNPTADILNISIPDYTGKNARVTLYDMDGKIIMATTANSKLFQLDLHRVASGNYLLVIDSNSRLYKKSIIRN